ncbi:PAS domain-containing protein [Roseospira marina]|uniref:PAS domain-containing protein n=1 Tax=Roseospira marina TaxID=140057 RepID=A0A5M6IF13_9PROT|nr:HD domain-containing phosphohydrolase [Roseospira marina]KAA5606722.1 PAS domain-containing protein [Roseospira marina]MBB4313862.1 PAS domain S-box-containing protein [Roseospira marina]MBB5087024.1 PAS domain S-box-containing protein [Roseospira marina]
MTSVETGAGSRRSDSAGGALDVGGDEAAVAGVRRAMVAVVAVLVLAAIIGGALVYTLNEAEALDLTGTPRRVLLIGLSVAVLGLLGAAAVLWRYGVSVRLTEMAARQQSAADRLRETAAFVRIVTDGQPTAIAAVDEDGRYSFANAGAAWGTGLTPDQMIGRTVTEVMGPRVARRLQAANANALLGGAPVRDVAPLERDGAQRMVKTDHIPLPTTTGQPRSVLMVLEDVSDLMAERERRETTLRDLVATLVGLVDRRDPYSSDHSARVAELAFAIAREMGEPDAVCRTVDIVGTLMNLGKILVPEEILTRSGPITVEEINTVRAAVVQSADLLGGVAFDLPVAECLRQIQERWDGKGYPDGRKGEDILVAARIVMVANAFVGMVSPRAFRGPMSVESAMEELMEGVGARYDRRPVAALMNYLENRGGADRWRARVEDRPESGAAASA